MRCLVLGALEEELGHLHVLRMHSLALPCVHIPGAVGETLVGHRGRRETVSSQWAPGERGAHPSPGWDGERDPRLQGRAWWGRANSCWCCFLVSGGRKLVPVDPGWDLVTCKLGLEMKSCWRGPGVSLGPQLSCCYWKLLERGLEALSPPAGTATLPPSPGSQGTKGLCQHVQHRDPCPDPPQHP